MDKIAIITDHSQRYNTLIAYLRRLFPECEIQILSSRDTTHEGMMINKNENDELYKEI